MHDGACGLRGKGIHIPNSGGGGDGAGSIHQASVKRSIIICYLSWRGFQVLSCTNMFCICHPMCGLLSSGGHYACACQGR